MINSNCLLNFKTRNLLSLVHETSTLISLTSLFFLRLSFETVNLRSHIYSCPTALLILYTHQLFFSAFVFWNFKLACSSLIAVWIKMSDRIALRHWFSFTFTYCFFGVCRLKLETCRLISIVVWKQMNHPTALLFLYVHLLFFFLPLSFETRNLPAVLCYSDIKLSNPFSTVGITAS